MEAQEWKKEDQGRGYGRSEAMVIQTRLWWWRERKVDNIKKCVDVKKRTCWRLGRGDERKRTIKNDFQTSGSLSGWKAIFRNRDTNGRLRFLRLWRNQEFSFGHVKCDIPVKHLNWDVKWEACLESRDMIWTGHINWGVIDISMKFQVWGTCIQGEDKRF